jgi:hypothetical protein
MIAVKEVFHKFLLSLLFYLLQSPTSNNRVSRKQNHLQHQTPALSRYPLPS